MQHIMGSGKVSIFRSACTEKLSNIRPNATFLTIYDYINNFGEVADHSVCFHINYFKAVEKAKQYLKNFNPQIKHCINRRFNFETLKRAKKELLQSYEWTLEGYNPLATSAHAYDIVLLDKDGDNIPGIKLHRDQDILHLWGYRLHKRIIHEGNYPKDNRMPKTIAKEFLRNLTPLGKFGQYKLATGRFSKFTVEKLSITEDEILRRDFLETRDGTK